MVRMWNSSYRVAAKLSSSDPRRSYGRKKQSMRMRFVALLCTVQLFLLNPYLYDHGEAISAKEHFADDSSHKTQAAKSRYERKTRSLSDENMKLLSPKREHLGSDVCDRVLPHFPKEPMFQEQCKEYELLPFIVPVSCTPDKVVIPKILHTVSESNILPPHYYITAKANPDFVLKHHSDESALEYIKKNCGVDVAQAYTCLKAPAFRADIFRFCALVAEGGVYLDSDIVPLLQLEELYSPCASATLGYDIPQYDHSSKAWQEGKQMKILAATPNAPIFQCMLDRIVQNARRGSIPWSPLAVSGPLLLHQCYEDFPAQVAITYKDTRNALWPFTGLRRGREMVAYEVASKRFFDDSPTIDYGKLFLIGDVYGSCPLQDIFTFPSIEQRVEYYMGHWYEEREFDVDLACAYGIFNSTQWHLQPPKLYTGNVLRRFPGIHFDDVREYMFPYWNTNWAIYLLHLGEISSQRHKVPVVSASRPAELTSKGHNDGKAGPILAPMMTIRQFQNVNNLIGDDIVWEKKHASLIWRGKSNAGDERTQQVLAAVTSGFDVKITEMTGNCAECVKQRVDVKGDHLSLSEMLKHKYLLSLEGRGASSGLAWMLASNSVVFMSKPKRVTWIMEDILVPWYHYIPVNDDLSDLEEKVEWAKQNDADCKRIVDNSSEYMRSLWTTTKAQFETRKIMFHLVTRYKALYGVQLQHCLEPEA